MAFQGTSSLHVIYIGGETANQVVNKSTTTRTADAPAVSYPSLTEDLWRRFNATVYKLQHRYYEQSYPVP